jgi:hypothetical protein
MTRRIALAVALLTLPALALVANAAPRRHHRPRPPVENCPTECGVRLTHGPWRYRGEEAVTDVCIKAGRRLYAFTSDGTNGCYTVVGLGTTHVTVRERREHRECNDISSVTFYHDCDPETPPPPVGGDGDNQPG